MQPHWMSTGSTLRRTQHWSADSSRCGFVIPWDIWWQKDRARILSRKQGWTDHGTCCDACASPMREDSSLLCQVIWLVDPCVAACLVWSSMVWSCTLVLTQTSFQPSILSDEVELCHLPHTISKTVCDANRRMLSLHYVLRGHQVKKEKKSLHNLQPQGVLIDQPLSFCRVLLKKVNCLNVCYSGLPQTASNVTAKMHKGPENRMVYAPCNCPLCLLTDRRRDSVKII